MVIGGSGGSAALNEAFAGARRALVSAGVTGLWVGVPGARSDDAITCQPWCDDTAAAIAAADVVVTVGGAVTLAEAGVVGRPCVVLPRRDVAADHQWHNAQALWRRRAVVVATPAGLAADVIGLLDHETRARALAAALTTWASPRMSAPTSVSASTYAAKLVAWALGEDGV